MPSQQGMTISTWNNTLNWLQWESQEQVGFHHEPWPVAHMRRLKIVDDEAKKIRKATNEIEKWIKTVINFILTHSQN